MSYDPPRVAYFCMEYGLSETFPIYSGGLGVLAGDFMRSCKALDLPVVGVGLVWADGYTTQALSSKGFPEDHPTPLDRSVLIPEKPVVSVNVAGREVHLNIFRVEAFDNATLYLLEPVEARDRWITKRLYGGGKDDRVAQEILLGIGGVRALRALGVGVDVYHFNEGHALFAGLELLSEKRAQGFSFERAWETVRPHIVFTTHTPVDAGNEVHEIEHLQRMGATLNFKESELVRLGGDPFNMTAAALRLSTRANAVAELHGETARHMWRGVNDGAPINAITNGVDHRVWQDRNIANAFVTADDPAMLSAHDACKCALLSEIETRTSAILNPDLLLIGFARRATAYKRATLFFHDRLRAEALLDRGAQIVFAGKSHPKDSGGRELVHQLAELERIYPGQVVFIPNYDLHLGRLLTRGCDIWLNTPRRPLEACGTSGMKAAMNGVLNVSILDGWWPEGCEHGQNGWKIEAPGSDAYPSNKEGDEADARALYELLENEVLPAFADRPRWAKMMRGSIEMSRRFTSDRMVRDYFASLYTESSQKLAASAR